jgi:TRIAD3 protein (E3 ubiquitin-protein ligase RNF216)
LDYAQKDREYRGGIHYADLSLNQLMLDFPFIPKPHIRRTLVAHHSLYAPTYLFLAEEKRRGEELSYTPKTIPSRAPKGKGKALHDPEFEKEREWLLSQREDSEGDQDLAVVVEEEEYVDCGDGIECGCCFSTYPFVSDFFRTIRFAPDLLHRIK